MNYFLPLVRFLMDLFFLFFFKVLPLFFLRVFLFLFEFIFLPPLLLPNNHPKIPLGFLVSDFTFASFATTLPMLFSSLFLFWVNSFSDLSSATLYIANLFSSSLLLLLFNKSSNFFANFFSLFSAIIIIYNVYNKFKYPYNFHISSLFSVSVYIPPTAPESHF